MTQNKNIKLDDRLLSCADYVRKGSRLLDIGTDHAYLPIFLALKGSIASAIASDVNLKPLDSAEMNIQKFHVRDIVKTRQSNGFENIQSHEVDDIVIAGMGGETIMDIIHEVSWLKTDDIQLILQPMTMEEELRSYLKQNRYYVLKEKASFSSGKVYTTMLVIYQNGRVNENPYFENIGVLSASNQTDCRYIKHKIKKYKSIISGLEHASTDQNEKIQYYKRTVAGLEIILSEENKA